MAKTASRFAAWRSNLADRLARSSRVFLLGIIVACGIEVVVDWNQTLYEINVLRDQIRLKGVNYAGLLSRAIVESMLSGRSRTMDRLAEGILDDEDAIFIRIVDATGKIVYERIEPSFEKEYARRGKGSYREHYGHWLDRDLRAVIADPEGFRQRLAGSRYRDLPQIYSDATAQVMARFSPPPRQPPSRAEIVFQDRLRDENHRRDDTMSWAVAPLGSEGKKFGAVLVAFDMTRTIRAVEIKYLKGLGMIVFFVALILMQSVVSRRDKLRLLDLERRYAAAKRALRDAMPSAPVTAGSLTAAGAVEQARGPVDGLIWDAVAGADGLALMVVDPDGDGIDAAAIALHMTRTFRSRQQSGKSGSLNDELAALGAASREIPLTRPISILLLNIDASGQFSALLGDFVSLKILSSGSASAVAAAPLGDDLPDGIVGPLFRCQGVLPVGSTLLCACAGKGVKGIQLDGEGLARYLLRSRTAAVTDRIEDAAIWARGRNAALAENDIAVVAVRRS